MQSLHIFLKYQKNLESQELGIEKEASYIVSVINLDDHPPQQHHQ
jgi:hypothetical protein